jgi:phospholipase C
MMHRIVAAFVCAGLIAGCSSTTPLPASQAPFAADLQDLSANPLLVGPPPVKGSPIQHVIVLIQENRTMDNMFNGFPGADTVLTGRDEKGRKVHLQAEGLEWPFDPDHAHASLVKEYNHGAMNGFARETCDFNPYASSCSGASGPPENFAYSYVPQEETQFLFILGGAFYGIGYGIADKMFSGRQVPSFPGHLDLIAGQSVAADDPIGPGESALKGIWGCDAPAGAKVGAFKAKYTAGLRFVFPCFNYQTLADLMDAKHVTWKYYTGTIGTSDGTLNAYDAIKHVRYGPDWNKNFETPMTDIFADIQHGTLPQVSFVTPPGPASDHAGFLTSGGPAWVTSIYIYLTENPKLYKNTAIFVTWDDSGGWYDHVKPPSDSFGPLGFRVPLMAMSPYAKRAVSHRQHDFGSILHFIEKNWKLGNLGQADATADDLSDMFNYKQKPIPPVVNFGKFTSQQIVHKYSADYFRNMLDDHRPVDSE